MMGDWLLAMHTLGALLWVGSMAVALAALLPGRRSITLADRIRLRIRLFRRFFLIVWHAMPIVLLTGYGMVFGVYGGMAGVGWNVHLMHLLGLIMGALFIWIVFGPWAAFRGGDEAAITLLPRLILISLVFGIMTVVIAGLNG
jgi:uncharacterized membrane protein